MEKNILKYEDFLLNESKKWVNLQVNESNLDIKSFIKKTFNKIKKLSKDKKKTFLIYALTSALALTNASDIMNVINNDPEIQTELKECPDLKEIIEDKVEKKVNLWETQFNIPNNMKWVDPTELRLSQDGWNHLKKTEGKIKKPGKPVLKAYKLGDGRITIGWGHAEPISASQFSVGDKISVDKAQELLEEDTKIAADGVRRIFRDWKKEGIVRTLTQNQFDVLVSMSFNMGVSGLRRSDVISAIKEGDYVKAGNLIKGSGISKKFKKGHTSRREIEANMFLKWVKK